MCNKKKRKLKKKPKEKPTVKDDDDIKGPKSGLAAPRVSRVQSSIISVTQSTLDDLPKSDESLRTIRLPQSEHPVPLRSDEESIHFRWTKNLDTVKKALGDVKDKLLKKATSAKSSKATKCPSQKLDKINSVMKKAEMDIKKKLVTSKSKKGPSRPAVISGQPLVTASKAASEIKNPAQQPTPAPLLTPQSNLPLGQHESSQLSVLSSNAAGPLNASQLSGISSDAINNKSGSSPQKTSPVVNTSEDVDKTPAQSKSTIKSQVTGQMIFNSIPSLSGANSRAAKPTDANVMTTTDKKVSNSNKNGQSGKQIELTKVAPLNAEPIALVLPSTSPAKDAKKGQPQRQPANNDKDNSKK